MKISKELLEEMWKQWFWQQGLLFTFRNDADGIRALSVVNGLARSAKNRELVELTLGSHDWGCNANRTQAFWMPINFDWVDPCFVGIAERGIESIHTYGASVFQAVVTGKEKFRREAMERILDGVFPRSFRREVTGEWGANISAFFDESRPLPVLHVAIEHGGETVVSAEVSCWSGILFIPGRFLGFCESPQDAQHQIALAFNAWLEVFTTKT